MKEGILRDQLTSVINAVAEIKAKPASANNIMERLGSPLGSLTEGVRREIMDLVRRNVGRVRPGENGIETPEELAITLLGEVKGIIEAGKEKKAAPGESVVQA